MQSTPLKCTLDLTAHDMQDRFLYNVYKCLMYGQ